MFPGYFKRLIDWVLRILVILSVGEKIHGILKELEMKIGEEKLKIPSDRPRGTAPTRSPKDRIWCAAPVRVLKESICPSGFGAQRFSELQSHLETLFSLIFSY